MLFEIYCHALKDVAIAVKNTATAMKETATALTFRSGNEKKPPTPKGFSPFPKDEGILNFMPHLDVPLCQTHLVTFGNDMVLVLIETLQAVKELRS